MRTDNDSYSLRRDSLRAAHEMGAPATASTGTLILIALFLGWPALFLHGHARNITLGIWIGTVVVIAMFSGTIALRNAVVARLPPEKEEDDSPWAAKT